jgi:hypothetical protein
MDVANLGGEVPAIATRAAKLRLTPDSHPGGNEFSQAEMEANKMNKGNE